MIAKRRNERFKRIKCSTLARLLRESLAEESIYQLNRDGEVQASDSISQMGAQQQMMGARPGGAAAAQNSMGAASNVGSRPGGRG